MINDKRYVVETTPSFEREYEKLKKKFPKIDDDFEEFINEIELHGDLGEDIPKVIKNGNKIF